MTAKQGHTLMSREGFGTEEVRDDHVEAYKESGWTKVEKPTPPPAEAVKLKRGRKKTTKE